MATVFEWFVLCQDNGTWETTTATIAGQPTVGIGDCPSNPAFNVTAVRQGEAVSSFVTNADQVDMASTTIKANPTSSSATPQDFSISTQGDILTRNATDIIRLGTGTVGQVLTSGGAGADLSWETGTGTGTVTTVTQGTGMNFSVNPITVAGTINLANTAVTPGSFINASITVDAQGRLTAASSGTSSGVEAYDLYETQAFGVGPADTPTAGTFIQRTITTLNPGGGNVTLASNDFTLTAGTWLITGSCPAQDCGAHKCRLVTSAAPTVTVKMGTTEDGDSAGTGGSQTRTFITHYVVLGVAETYRITHAVQDVGNFGLPAGFMTPEIYTQLHILKLA